MLCYGCSFRLTCIKFSYCYRVWCNSCTKVSCRAKCTVTDTKQYGDNTAIEVSYSQVKVVVGVKITYCYRGWSKCYIKVICRAKCAVTVTNQYGDSTITPVSYSQIQIQVWKETFQNILYETIFDFSINKLVIMMLVVFFIFIFISKKYTV